MMSGRKAIATNFVMKPSTKKQPSPAACRHRDGPAVAPSHRVKWYSPLQ
jgi:hypothetical protein